MRALLLVLLLVPALLLGCAGCATPDAYPRRPTAQEIASVEGLYSLSDGYRLHVFDLDSRLYARIGAGSQKMLEAVGRDLYASPDGDVSIWFQRAHAWGDPEQVVVAYYRAPGGHPPRMFSTGPRPGRGFLD
jgi:hypothetical protein